MPNVKQIIASHNTEVKRKNEPTVTPNTMCRCRDKNECPLEQKCLTTGVIYQATVTRQDTLRKETYIGLTEGDFKTRFTNHKCDFNNAHRRNTTTLSRYIWSLKDKNILYSVQWKIVSKSSSYSNSSKSCNLCLTEKYFIIFQPEMSSLNHRNELASTCLHRKNYLLRNVNG